MTPMTSDVLVLNKSFFAIQVTSWQRAMSLVYLDHASVVDQDYRTYSFSDWRDLSALTHDHPNGCISTPQFKIAIPEVISLKMYDRLPLTEVQFTRRNLYEHYNYTCCYCGKKLPSTELNLDHVIPRARGGKTTWKNIVTSCIPCNLRKGCREPYEAGMRMRVKPSKPAWRGPLALYVKSPKKMKSSWQRFIDTMYWNNELERD